MLGLAFLVLWQAFAGLQPTGRGIPGPAAVAATAIQMLAHPCYNNGPNDKGIGLQLAASLGRLGVGWVVASVVAIMGGVALGLWPTLYRAVNPYVQVLKPISPLAWMPLFLYTIKDSSQSARLLLPMTSLWPTLATPSFRTA